MALSLEIMNMEVYEMVFNSEYFTIFPIPEKQIQLWRQLQSRMVDATPLTIIFCQKYNRNGSFFDSFIIKF